MIKEVHAREVLDSRGNPTVECEIITHKGSFSGMVPSGASTGSHEALEMRDGDSRYQGKGVLKAVSNINNIISKKILGLDSSQQQDIDELLISLDGTENKKKIGANAILAVSIAVCRAGAASQEKPLFRHIASLSKNKSFSLPIPQLNVINGGKHAGIDNDIQEHMIMPIGSSCYSEGLRMSVEVYHTLKGILKKKFGPIGTNIADEGGFSPAIESIHDRLHVVMNAIEQCGYQQEISFALDCAASEFFSNNVYSIRNKKFSSDQLIDFYSDLSKTFPIISIEDGMAEDDWNGWIELTKKLGKKIQIVGDDLLVTNTARIKTAIQKKAANATLIKLNQIGTVSETIDAVNLTHQHKWKSVVSQRSGETEDPFSADFCVGVGASQFKMGAPARSERLAKYNQLLRIEETIGKKYSGKLFR